MNKMMMCVLLAGCGSVSEAELQSELCTSEDASAGLCVPSILQTRARAEGRRVAAAAAGVPASAIHLTDVWCGLLYPGWQCHVSIDVSDDVWVTACSLEFDENYMFQSDDCM